MRINHIGLIALLCIISFASSVKAQKSYGIKDSEVNALLPPAKGTLAPDIQVTLADGSDWTLDAALVNGPIVLIFYRGEWCPVCNRHLSALEEDLSTIHDLGGQVVAVTPQLPEYIEKTRDKTGFSSVIIPDLDHKVMTDYGVLFEVSEAYVNKIRAFLFTDIARSNGDAEAVLPIPATFVIAQDRVIRYVHHNKDYKNRVDAQEMIKVLKELDLH